MRTDFSDDPLATEASERGDLDEFADAVGIEPAATAKLFRHLPPKVAQRLLRPFARKTRVRVGNYPANVAE